MKQPVLFWLQQTTVYLRAFKDKSQSIYNSEMYININNLLINSEEPLEL